MTHAPYIKETGITARHTGTIMTISMERQVYCYRTQATHISKALNGEKERLSIYFFAHTVGITTTKTLYNLLQ